MKQFIICWYMTRFLIEVGRSWITSQEITILVIDSSAFSSLLLQILLYILIRWILPLCVKRQTFSVKCSAFSMIFVYSPWHLVPDLFLFPVSSFIRVLHGTPSGHPWCLPPTIFLQLLPIERADGNEDRFLTFVRIRWGYHFFWDGSPRPSSVDYYDRFLLSA